MYRNPVILQISDLHFGKSVKLKFWNSSVNDKAKKALQQAVLEIQPRPDFLVVTGDLANGGKVEELRESKQFLLSLLDGLWNEHQATRCILIPGNHDVWRTTWARPSGYIGRRDRLEEWHSVFHEWSFLSGRVPTTESVHLQPKSLEEYYLAGGASLKQAQQRSRSAIYACEYFPDFQVAFLKLDSNLREHPWKPGHIARGMVGLDQRQAVDACLRDYLQATRNNPNSFGDARRVALVHHHVTRLPNVNDENWMLMDDAGEVARWLARHSVRLVLHGHYHRADVVGLKYWNTESNNSKVETIVISAGSATAKDADDGHNSCHYIDMGQFRTTVWRPNLDNGEYQPLAAAAKFEFTHKPDLEIVDGDTDRIPVFLEALTASAATEERYADQKHSYTLVDTTGYIDEHRSYYGSVILEGKNITQYPTRAIPFLFTAVGAQDFDQFACAAWDLKTGLALQKPELIEGRPINAFPMWIHFAAPLASQDDFKIRVMFRLPMVMFDNNDYDMYSLLRFPRGLRHLNMRLASKKKFVGVSVWEMRGERLVESLVEPQQVSLTPPNPPGTGAVSGFEINLEAPSALSYLIFYHKLE